VRSANCIPEAAEPLLPIARLPARLSADAHARIVHDSSASVVYDKIDWAKSPCQDDMCGVLGVEWDPNRTGEVVASAHWNEAEDPLPRPQRKSMSRRLHEVGAWLDLTDLAAPLIAWSVAFRTQPDQMAGV